MSPSLYYVSLGMLVRLMRLRKANHGYFPVFTYFWVMRARLTTTALYYLRLFIDHYMTYLTTGMAKRQNVNFKEGVAGWDDAEFRSGPTSCGSGISRGSSRQCIIVKPRRLYAQYIVKT